MVNFCVAVNCNSSSTTGVSFFKFPNDKNMSQKWANALRRDNWTPTKSSKLCFKHFKPEDFAISGWTSKKKLKPDAVPSIFDFPTHLIKKEIRRPPPKGRDFVPTASSTCTSDPREGIASVIEIECNEARHKEAAENTSKLPPSETIGTSCNDLTSADEPSVADVNTEPATKKRKKRQCYVGDFECNDEDNALKIAKQKLIEKSKKVKSQQRKISRLYKKIRDFKELIERLRKDFSATDIAIQALLSSVPESSKKFFIQMLSSGGCGKRYPDEMKCFAMTLDFYSPKAYDYVRKTFNYSLPHRRTIQKWYQSVCCEPGFSFEALEALKHKAKLAKEKGRRVVCSLMFDEMSIRKQVDVFNGKLVGYVDFGEAMDSDEAPLAKDVLVFMLSSLNDNWKIPVGYFLINSLTSDEKGNLLKKCLIFLHEADIDVLSVAFDGLYANVSMCRLLGIDLALDDLKPWFLHPVTERKMFIFPDPPHMLKLVRNAFHSFKVIYDSNERPINWEYLDKLVAVQEEEGLHVATKIRKRHMNWEREKMKVKIAAQILSNSVAKALEYLRITNYNNSFFQDSEATELFIIGINNAFDILNSRNILKAGLNGGLTRSNYLSIFEEIESISTYIKELRELPGGTLVIDGRRKMGFLGLLTSLQAVKGLFQEYVIGDLPVLNYLLPYKMSQDHLEIFFSCIRSRGGYNNNPSALQFKNIYKRLLLHTEIKGSKYANCLDMDQVCPSILALTSSRSVVIKGILPSSISVDEAEEQFLKTMSNKPIVDHDYNLVNFPMESEYVADVIGYIAGFVVRQLFKVIYCEICRSALENRSECPSLLLSVKEYRKNSENGLIRASSDVLYLCNLSEKTFRRGIITTNAQNLNLQRMTVEILKNVQKPLFCEISDHQFDQSPLDNHLLHMSKMIIYKYLIIRLHHESSKINEDAKSHRVRSMLTKQILFANQ